MEDDSYSINPDIDMVINKAFPPKNFGNIFLSLLPLSLDDSFNKKESPTNLLLEAVKHEYGIKRDINFQAALDSYISASKQNNPYSLYKLYLISKDPSHATSFNVTRNKNLEMFNLFKAYAYSDQSLNRHRLYQADYDLCLESNLSKYLSLDDPSLDKANKLFIDIAHTVDEIELSYIEAIIIIRFNIMDDDRALGISVLHDLADSKCYLHAVWKLACLYNEEKNIEMAGKYFRILIDKKFYESYQDCLAFEINKSPDISCDRNYFREILSEAIMNGYYKCFNFYYRLSLFDLDFKEINKFFNENENFILSDIVGGNYFILLDYFIIMKRIKKSAGINPVDNKRNYFDIILSKLSENYKNIFMNDSSHSKIFLYLTMAYFYYSIGKDYEEAEKLFKKSYDLLIVFKENYSKSYLRFCYFYILKTRLKLFKASFKLEKNKLEKTKLKLFKIFNDPYPKINSESFTNSSFDYYCLGKIYEHGWGTEINELKSFAFYQKSSSSNFLDFSFISFYKRNKSKQKNLTQEKFSLLSQKILKFKNSEISKLDESSLCNICFEDKIEILFLPCKHMTCKECYMKKFKIERKCPICRNEIISIL